MSRISEAMQRAGQNGDESQNVTSAAEDAQFDAAEESIESPEPEIEVPVGAGALVPRVRTLPVEVIRRDSGDDIELRDVVQRLLARWRLICYVVIASLAVAAVYNQVTPRIYEARARLLIEPESPQVMPFRTLTEDTGRYDYFLTQLEVLRSRDLTRKTMDRLHLTELPGAIVVTPVKTDVGPTRVVNVTFRSADPELAVRIANGLAQIYVEQNLEVRTQGSREAAKWLNDRLAELRQQVNTSQGALQQYREEKNSVALGDQQNIVVQKLAQLSATVTTARTEKLAHQALYDQLSAMEQAGAPLDTFPPVLSNTFVQGLKTELAGLQRERGQLAERLGDLHPDMIKIDTAIAVAERRLKAEIDKVAEGVRNDFRTAEARERGLASALEAQKREVLDLSQKSIGYGALQRDATSTQQVFESVLQRLKETQLSVELQTNNVRILDIADVPRIPIWPRTRLNLIVALLGGGFVAVGLVIGLEYLNPRIIKPNDVRDVLGLPLIGVAPRVAALTKGRLNVDNLPPSFEEALRSIRTRILLSPIAGAARTLAVTSASPGEGKTVVASSLAVSMTMAGRRVLLVDADMRRPQIHRIFNVSASPGLANIMAGEVKPSEALRESAIKGLFVLPAGADVTNPSQLLDSEHLGRLIHGLSQVFDVVLLDCPPVMAIADASIIANAADSVLFVVGAGATSREAAQAAVERLTSVQGQVVGVVLNRANQNQSGYGYAYYQRQGVA